MDETTGREQRVAIGLQSAALLAEMPVMPDLDIREQIARVDRALAESEKLRLEMRNFIEARRLTVLKWLVGANIVLTVAVLVKLFH